MRTLRHRNAAAARIHPAGSVEPFRIAGGDESGEHRLILECLLQEQTQLPQRLGIGPVGDKRARLRIEIDALGEFGARRLTADCATPAQP